ncbi:uncharacterized protein [Choristoneura fumiferana]|uniref:uncharacterized protein n=1 Tax=Choristoneura fumiferana TaxID=7141 RepID=UPI003D15A8B4
MSDHFENEDVITYNPKYISEHYDSSEFGDHGDDEPKSILIGPHILKKFVAEKDDSNNKVNTSKCESVHQKFSISVVTSTVPCHHCGRLVENNTETFNLQPSQNGNCSQGTSKENIKKNLSGSIQCSNNRKMAVTEGNDRNAINNTRVYCPDCRQRQIRKFYRKQQLYRTINTNEDKTLQPLAPKTQTPVQEPTKTYFSNTNTVCASEVKLRQKKVYKYVRGYEHNKETKEEFLKHKTNKNQLLNRSQQYSRYAVYNSQCCQARDDGPSTSACCKMPVNSSFWEFMFNKLSAKYQEALNLAACEDCRPINCNMIRQPKTKLIASQETSETQTETCEVIPNNRKSNKPTTQKINECQTCESISGKRSMFELTPQSSRQSSPTTSKRSNSPNSKLKCSGKCFSKCASKTPNHEKPLTKLTFPDNSKSCQLSHEGLTKALKEKYNGEVLCIHNPPCILINGCVNLPHQAPKPLDIWQITTARRKADPKMNHRLEICQLPSVELKCGQDKTPDKMRHICNHSSQCEVVPICYKSSRNPEFMGSCEHEPSCHRVPVCLIETEQKITRFSCEHMPLSELPNCSFELSDISVNKHDQESSVSDGITQVEQPHRLKCPHKPPCLMIPKCLGQVMVIRRKGGAIPDCIHQPPCEYIPACGRDYVKMLAACSCTISSRPQCRIT